MSRLSFLGRTSMIVGIFFGLDKALAFVRTGIITRQYRGSVTLLDTFNAANNLPDVLFALISGGALAMAFIPLLSEYLTQRDRAAAWDVFSRVANVGFTLTAGFALVIAIFAQPIADFVITPGFSAEQRTLLAELMRLNLIGTIIFSVSGLVMAGLQANQHFILPALAPTMYNVGQILGAVFLVPHFGIHGLVYGVILGAALHLLIQIPGLVRFGFRWTPSLNVRHTGLVQALKLMAPRLLTMGGIQTIFVARDWLASWLPQEGAVSSLTYGWMIMQVPETILGTAVATALLPTLSEFAARQDWPGFRSTIERALRGLIALSLPIAAIMAAGIHPLVQAVFGFDESTTVLLAWTTRAYLLTLTGYCIHEIAARSFYARQEPLFPLYAVLIRLAVFLAIGVTAITVFRDIGAPIIALAEIALLVEAVVLLIWLSRRSHERIAVDGAVLRGLIAALVGTAVTVLVAWLAGPFVQSGLAGLQSIAIIVRYQEILQSVLSTLLGMAAGGALALIVIWREVRLLFNL